MLQQSFTDEQVINSLKACKGMIFLAAKKLGCDPSVVSSRVKVVRRVAEVVRVEKEATKDFVELKIIEAIHNGEPWAIKFYASTQMRDRGYGEQSDLTLHGSVTIPFMPRRGDLPVFKAADPERQALERIVARQIAPGEDLSQTDPHPE